MTTSHSFTLTAQGEPHTFDAEAEARLVDRYRNAMARFPAAVSIVTTGVGEDRRGFTASAVFSISMAPPLIGVCVNKSVDAHDALLSGRIFCVNVLERDQEEIANRFAARDGSKGAVRFTRNRWDQLTTGSPTLEGCAASIDCELSVGVDAGTHTILVGRVRDIRVHPEREPLIYFDRHFAVARILESADVPAPVAPIDGW